MRKGIVMHGRFIWTELLTGDVEAAKADYAALAGWTYEGAPMPHGGTYWVASRDGKPCAGIMGLDALPPGSTPLWFVYLGCDDVDAACRSIASQGGCVSKPPWDIPGVGRIAAVVDSQGACFGLMKPV